MWQEIDEISREISHRRRLAGLSQKKLAELSGISQSTIAKIENRYESDYNPSYECVRKILEVLEKIKDKRKGTRAKDIMNKKVVGIQNNDQVERAMKIMERKAYSRLPVFNEKILVGSISESTIHREMLEGRYRSLEEIEVGKIMDEPFPIIDENTPKDSFLSLLKFSPAILVRKKGEISGIITKADLLKIT